MMGFSLPWHTLWLSHGVWLLAIGFPVGLVSGLVGIGGGLLLIPVLLYIPPLMHLWLPESTAWMPNVPVSVATGLAAAQTLVAGAAGGWVHWKKGSVHPKLLAVFACIGGLAAYVGGVFSAVLSPFGIKLVLLLALSVLGVLAFPRREEQTHLQNEVWQAPSRISWWVGTWLATTAIGLLSGILGIGGAAFLTPLMDRVMKVPVRLAVGTGAALVFFTAIFSVTAKWQLGWIPWPEAGWLCLSAWLGATVGAHISHQLSPSWLRRVLFTIVATSWLRTVAELFSFTDADAG
jgi:uncharacterized membrane protein YfcA